MSVQRKTNFELWKVLRHDPAAEHGAGHGRIRHVGRSLWPADAADPVVGPEHPDDPALRAVPGPWAFLTAALLGFLAASTLPLLLVIAQELMAGRAGLASGLIMGLGFAMSAVGIPITGWIGDQHGIQDAMRFQAVIGAATFALAWLLPTEGRIRELTSREVE